MSELRDSAADGLDSLFARARGGDQAAWRELFDASYPKILARSGGELNSPAMRSLYDSTDFIGDVWKSLAERPENFDFSTLDDLQNFLAKAAQQKVIDQYRRLHAQKNDIERRPAARRHGSAPTTASPTCPRPIPPPARWPRRPRPARACSRARPATTAASSS